MLPAPTPKREHSQHRPTEGCDILAACGPQPVSSGKQAERHAEGAF